MTDRNILENKIRITVMINIFFVLLYHAIVWENTNASWVHTAHVASDALVVLATLMQVRSITGIVTLMQIGILALDGFVVVLTAVMINRCLQELSNSCMVRFAEGTLWILIGLGHVLATLFQVVQLYRLFYTEVKYYVYSLRQRNAHIFKLGPVLLYLLLGNPTGIDRLFIIHPIADTIGIFSTVSKDNWGSFAILLSVLLLGLDLLLFTKREGGFEGDLKLYTLYWLAACDVALLIFSSKRSVQSKDKFV